MRKNLANRLSSKKVSFKRPNVPTIIAFTFVAIVVFVGFFGRQLAPFGPLEFVGAPGNPPNSEMLMGGDSLGRDVFSRLLVGTRWSLIIGFGATGLALIAGSILGSIAGTSHKYVDEFVMRTLDVIMAFPGIALAAVLVTVFGNSIGVIVVTIAFLYTPSVARVVRANVMAQYSEDYVAAERVLGATKPHILIKHVARNIAAPVLVFATVMVADAIVFEASLSFLGAGIQPPNPSWGSVINDGKELVAAGAWWATFWPGMLILATVLALNIVAEGISDAWASAGASKAGSASVADTKVRELTEKPEGTTFEVPGVDLAGKRIAANARVVPDSDTVIDVQNLSIGFPARYGDTNVVHDVSFSVRRGEIFGLVGESGSGKSLTTLTIMGLQASTAKVTGKVVFNGRDITDLTLKQRQNILGREIAMIYQDALGALNPSMKISAQLDQLIKRGGTRGKEELMQLVGLPPERILNSYPHELSGGQRQRVVIAMALSRDPSLIIADEPTTALDVTVQAQVIELLVDLQKKLGFALILVSHDLALVADTADRVAVLYGGRICETGDTAEVIGNPRHHYSRGLLASVLSVEHHADVLSQIPGTVPPPSEFPAGCRFAGRCPLATTKCAAEFPAITGADNHQVACHYPEPATQVAEAKQV
ncbi:dipeptide/oligopeptide/nickel ABC transporter permease/ATP-binding protein [Corynebacterium aquilae]|uniref:ABC transporter n=1 Tax=Corynebacterium aquilae DSM 44791 TaxID=1431546 RepID=A0A1L7CGJ5_9CORY|nr:dipeptide/oligopeptide/nickel ABC transporter permease/ATP-binding protein [Corynebacterium aquilae]APT84968.1 ABC transporter [Corynebacterium aquilae DSM 44791]